MNTSHCYILVGRQKIEEENLAEQSLNLASDTRERFPGPVFFTLI